MELHQYRKKTDTNQIVKTVKKKEWSCRSRHFLRHAVFTGLCALALSGPVHAQQEEKAPGATEPAATRIAVDEEAGVIRFFIEGQEKARLDATGLHVRDNINYGRSLTDYGPGGFDDQTDRRADYEHLKTEDRDAP